MTLVISDDAKWYAIAQYLSYWPEGVSADEVLSQVELNTDDVVIWEPFEGYDGADIVGWINDLAREFDLFANGQGAKAIPSQYRWYLGYIFTREGEREYKQTAVLKLRPDDDVALQADNLAEDWYGVEPEVSGNGYLFFNGEIYVEAGQFHEITEEVAITITEHPMHINWFMPDYETDSKPEKGDHEI